MFTNSGCSVIPGLKSILFGKNEFINRKKNCPTGISRSPYLIKGDAEGVSEPPPGERELVRVGLVV